MDMNAIVEEYLPKIRHHVGAMVPPDDADDVTQEIFLKLICSLHSFKGKSSFATWFNTIKRHTVADHYRKKYRHEAHMAKLPLPSEAIVYPTTVVEDNQLVEIILGELPEHYREVLMLRFFKDLSFAEIAKRLGVSYEPARSRCRRAIKMARKIAEERSSIHSSVLEEEQDGNYKADETATKKAQ